MAPSLAPLGHGALSTCEKDAALTPADLPCARAEAAIRAEPPQAGNTDPREKRRLQSSPADCGSSRRLLERRPCDEPPSRSFQFRRAAAAAAISPAFPAAVRRSHRETVCRHPPFQSCRALRCLLR